jgi:cytosine/adenosine deaminase-related metal-dependent hydrolase
MVHAAEGTDARARAELQALVDANVLRQNTVIVHGIGLSPDDGARLAAAGACLVWCPESNRRLYGATAPVPALRAAGVRVGLGSDSPVSGVRDALSNLAAARAEGLFADEDLFELATRDSAEVARLPLGNLAAGGRADLLAVESAERLLGGERTSVELVMRCGKPLYGAPELLATLAPSAVALCVDGAERRLAAGLARRAASLLGRWPPLRRAAWIEGLECD